MLIKTQILNLEERLEAVQRQRLINNKSFNKSWPCQTYFISGADVKRNVAPFILRHARNI